MAGVDLIAEFAGLLRRNCRIEFALRSLSTPPCLVMRPYRPCGHYLGQGAQAQPGTPPACAITIHKTQGSEFPAVLIPLSEGTTDSAVVFVSSLDFGYYRSTNLIREFVLARKAYDSRCMT